MPNPRNANIDQPHSCPGRTPVSVLGPLLKLQQPEQPAKRFLRHIQSVTHSWLEMLERWGVSCLLGRPVLATLTAPVVEVAGQPPLAHASSLELTLPWAVQQVQQQAAGAAADV